MHTTKVDVLVVGAGPAGLTTAITLARNGVGVLLVERHGGTSPFPKATGVSVRTMELFRTWGVEEHIRAGAMPVQPFLAVSETLAGPRFTTMPFGYPSDETALAHSPTTASCCPQDHLEPVLLDHLRVLGGHVRFATELVGLVVDPDGVTAQLREDATGRTHQVRARYLVGADGPRSTVRSRLGIGIEDLGTIGTFISVTFRADLTRRLPQVPCAINAVEVDGAAGLFVPTSTDDRWVYAREWQPERGEILAEWTPQRCVELLRAATGLTDLLPDILGVLPFVMGGHVATTFRSGRAFLVGDAAHRTTPVGGTGMNTAIQAAHNLGWKLAWVVRGWAGDALLDTYEAERRPVGTRNVLRSLRRGPEPSADGLAEDLGVCYETDVLASVEEAVGARPGERAPHVWTSHAGRRHSTVDLFDARLTVLTDGHGEGWRRAAAEMATGSGLPVTGLVVGQDLDDRDGALARRYGLTDSSAVLVRPDGYIAQRLAATADPRGALRGAVDRTLARSSGSALRRAA